MLSTELLKQEKNNESMTIEMEKDLKRLEIIYREIFKIGFFFSSKIIHNTIESFNKKSSIN